ncbi:hypothetical protein BH09PSE2_BH09PSE2_11940 [soil metagenome]
MTMELTCDYALTWRDHDAAWQVVPVPRRDATAQTVWIGGDREFRFEIIAPAAAVDSIYLGLLSGAPRDGLVMGFDLLLDGEPIARRAAQLRWNGEEGGLWADLSGVPMRAGAALTAVLTCPDAVGEEAGVRAWACEHGYEQRKSMLRLDDERRFSHQPPGLTGRAALVLVTPPGAAPARIAEAITAVRAAFPARPLSIVEHGTSAELWPQLRDAQAVVFADPAQGLGEPASGYDALCFALHRRGVANIALDTEGLATPQPGVDLAGGVQRQARTLRDAQRRCRFVLAGGVLTDTVGRSGAAPPTKLGTAGALADLAAFVRKRRLPKVAIVSVLYRKADVLPLFLQHVADQNYPGEIEVVPVDDRSPEPDVEVAEAFALRLEAAGRTDRKVRVLQNAENSGNCRSRLNGIEASTDADILIVIDCDCLLNRDFVAAHVFEHAFDDVDVVIGPLNIESELRDPAEVVREIERDPGLITQLQMVQDPVQLDGFLNCITRNFSIKAAAARAEPLFDEDFAYSAKPGSGFGWEDVEMGYRLYARGAVIRYTRLAFSVHCTHASSTPEEAKVLGSMRNFELLFAKHPDLALAGRRWAVDTYEKIAAWADGTKVDGGETRRSLDARFKPALERDRPLLTLLRGESRRLRVLSYRWHVPHQYELYKLPHDFTLATGIGENGMVDGWSFDQRPLRPNVSFAPSAHLDGRNFDVAVLHFDETVLSAQVCNGVIPASWGDPFRWLLAQDVPKVAICHGTVPFEGQYGLDPERKASFVHHEQERLRLVRGLEAAGVTVVCNSHQALGEWGFTDSRVIWHGFDPQEFPPGRHDLDILALAPDWHRPHYRGAWEQGIVEARLAKGRSIESAAHLGGAMEIRNSQDYAVRQFRSYVDRIGRFKFYLNTTLRSPMPRSRGEAMITGVIPACLPSHDVERFIDDGVNGILAQTPEALADRLNSLAGNEAAVRAMSAEARRTAMDVFNHDRYLTAWTQLLYEKAR